MVIKWKTGPIHGNLTQTTLKADERTQFEKLMSLNELIIKN